MKTHSPHPYTVHKVKFKNSNGQNEKDRNNTEKKPQE